MCNYIFLIPETIIPLHRFLFDVNSQDHKYYRNLVKNLRPGVSNAASSGERKRKRKSRWDTDAPKGASSSSSDNDAAVAAALAVAAEIEHSIPMSNREEEERQKQIREQQEVLIKWIWNFNILHSHSNTSFWSGKCEVSVTWVPAHLFVFFFALINIVPVKPMLPYFEHY